MERVRSDGLCLLVGAMGKCLYSSCCVQEQGKREAAAVLAVFSQGESPKLLGAVPNLRRRLCAIDLDRVQALVR